MYNDKRTNRSLFCLGIDLSGSWFAVLLDQEHVVCVGHPAYPSSLKHRRFQPKGSSRKLSRSLWTGVRLNCGKLIFFFTLFIFVSPLGDLFWMLRYRILYLWETRQNKGPGALCLIPFVSFCPLHAVWSWNELCLSVRYLLINKLSIRLKGTYIEFSNLHFLWISWALPLLFPPPMQFFHKFPITSNNFDINNLYSKRTFLNFCLNHPLC